MKFTYIYVRILRSTGKDSDKQVTHLFSFLVMLYFISHHTHQRALHMALGATAWDFYSPELFYLGVLLLLKVLSVSKIQIFNRHL